MQKNTKMVLVGDKLIGLVGLEEIFETLYKSKRKPGKEVREKLVSLVQKENYIPLEQKKRYAEALFRE